ncbi:SDR family oxidoreductase [Rhizobium sp. CF142]|uniref:SDR family oxidoreductase n=1 Tax=Rhizobium sp. CF142 TaxID=1144314 RepID=UPI00026EF43D|nr:SDR family oxidoreductase [Rhizobium sp. CF142]EJJ29483.1 putative nucleoside-diphosphate sugar epimerase [Rhizobium sp. CF142]
MKPIHLMLITGATGSIGRLAVEEAVGEGYRVRVLTRKPTKAAFPDGVEIVLGDLTRPDTLLAAVDGVNAVLFAHGTYGSVAEAERVDYGGVRNVLMALGNRHARLALMTAIAVTDRKGAHDWKRRGERLLRASGLSYTIVRPGWFDYNDADQLLPVLLQGDRRQSGTPRDGVIARRQIARILVKSFACPAADKKTFELVAEKGKEPQNFQTLFAKVDADLTDMLDGVYDTTNMPLDEEPATVVQDLRELQIAYRAFAASAV